MPGPEYTEVELPFIRQLEAMGWEYVEGSTEDPAVTGRETFSQVIQEGMLREQLTRINLKDGVPWLDDRRLSQAVSAIMRIPAAGVMEANQQATELLLKGIAVDGLPGWDGGRGQTIHYFDWERPENNRFTVINQFKVKCPPGFEVAGKRHIIPDLVLLVNGIPVVVIECKSRTEPEGLAKAVDQLRRYHNQRRASGETDHNEGSPALFHTNQLLAVSNFDDARLGAIGAEFEHFLAWKTVEPKSEAEVAAELGVESLSGQQRLVAGVLAKEALLDIIRHYCLFMTVGGQTIKVACRYQQYRAVSRSIERLKTGETRLEDGEYDRRGGIIWHTQGSGKSLTMVFLVRKLRTDPDLKRVKVVVVTDRKDLQRQLSATADLTGEIVEVARKTGKLKDLVRRPGPGLVFATIQKYREPTAAYPAGAEGLNRTEDKVASDDPARPPALSKPLGELNDSSDILVLVDEAHRTQAGDLHANLLNALPNCARIGFTGTPIIMGEKKRTRQIFGDFIDTYTIKESERDGMTVPVLYEGRTAKGAVRDGSSLDELFEDLFRDRSEDELEAIRKRYATKGKIVEAPQLIAEKAADMLRHCVCNILPNGWKAQVAAASRQAAVTYQQALEAARRDLLEQAMALDPADKELDDEQLIQRPERIKAAIMAWRQRELLQRIEFAAVISSDTNDTAEMAHWSDLSAVKEHIARFKKPLFHDDPDRTDSLAFLVVRTMLLTGFDAPIEAVLYLDRPIREAELLQAVARVNRTGHGKRHGIVVDYYGVANHLKDALAVYAEEDIEGALQSLGDEIPLLRDRHIRVVDVLRARGVEDLSDTESAVQALADERVRAEFVVKLRQFNETLDSVLPRPEALEFVNDAKRLAHIHALTRTRYKDLPEIGRDVGAKVRKLIADYVISLGIDPKIPPVQLTDAEFDEHVGRQVGDRAKASEMEHAIRSHVRKHLEEDPVKYGKLSERLEKLLEELDGQWEAQVEAFQTIVRQLRDDQPLEDEALPELPPHCLPFFRLLEEAYEQAHGPPEDQRRANLMDAAVEGVDIIRGEIRIPGFWKPARMPDQQRLKQRLFEDLFNRRIYPFDQVEPLVERLLELARANHEKLIEP